MIITATEPLLREHGRTISTRQIAEAAGIAEGTIFRVFDSKEALVDAVLERALSSEVTRQQLLTVDRDQELRDLMIDIARILQQRMIEGFTLMHALGPRTDPKESDRREMRDRMVADASLLGEVIIDLIGPGADRLLVDLPTTTFLLRAMVFALSHPMVAWVHGGTPHESTDPAAIVDLLLYGIDSTGPPKQRQDLAAALAPLTQSATDHPCP